MQETNENLKLWNQVEATDPKYTKKFTRSGGFSGTAVNNTYLVRKATEVFGPCGIGWGWEVADEKILDGPGTFTANGEIVGYQKVHVIRLRLWYMQGEKRGVIEHFGQTTLVGTNKHGMFIDEEAPKKSLTDALSKCLVMLGFGADVHLGLYDDNKYVQEQKDRFNNGSEGEAAAPQGGRPALRAVGGGASVPDDLPL